METVLGFVAKAIAGFADAVLEPDLLSGVIPACWPQAASAANTAPLTAHRIRCEATPRRARRWLRPSEVMLRLPQRLSHYPRHMSNASSHNVDAWIVDPFCKLANLSPLANVADLRQRGIVKIEGAHRGIRSRHWTPRLPVSCGSGYVITPLIVSKRTRKKPSWNFRISVG